MLINSAGEKGLSNIAGSICTSPLGFTVLEKIRVLYSYSFSCARS